MRLRGYKSIELIYEGENSCIFRAVRVEDNCSVILKKSANANDGLQASDQFENEFSILNSISTKYVPDVYDLIKNNDGEILVIEDIGGLSLKEVFNNHSLELSEKIEISKNFSKAIDEIHSFGVFHARICPSNLIVNAETGQVQVIDFSNSRIFNKVSDSSELKPGFQDDYLYMSPEQTGRMGVGIDHRTDLYSLGVTLYEFFSARKLFSFESELEYVHAHLAIEPDALHKLDLDFPEPISEIVARLLAKSPDKRYQSALGVYEDLKLYARTLTESGTAVKVHIGQYDKSSVLNFPDKLLGREKDNLLLIECLNKARQGSKEVVMVSGHSGVGKSSLIQNFINTRSKFDLKIGRGKFDLARGDVPYTALTSAFEQVVETLLTEPEESLLVWRDRILEFLGENAQIIIEVIPNLELIIGKQSPVSELPFKEGKERFLLVFRQFVRALIGTNEPVLIFIDDLQWADMATLKLVDSIVGDDELSHLVIIGAYRDNEIDQESDVWKQLILIFDHSQNLSEINLHDLTQSQVTKFLSESMNLHIGDVSELSELIFEKTAGNPFFTKTIINQLVQNSEVKFDHQSKKWDWDVQKIRNIEATRNVVDYLASSIKKQSDSSQELLFYAACIGTEFDLRTLAIVLQESEVTVLSELELLVELRMIDEKNIVESVEGNKGNIDNIQNRKFGFAHDRIQQAAYALKSEQQRNSIQLKIGQLLISEMDQNDFSNLPLQVIDHLNKGIDLLVHENERISLSKANFEAAQQSKISAAFEASKHYFEVAINLSDRSWWSHSYQFMLDLHKEYSEIVDLVGDSEQANSYIATGIKNAENEIDKIYFYVLQIRRQTALANYEEAIEIGRRALDQFGVTVPLNEIENALNVELDLANSISVKEFRALLNTKDAVDSFQVEKNQAIMLILMNLLPPTDFYDPDLNSWVSVKMVNYTFQFGYSPEAAKGLANYAVVLLLIGDYKKGVPLGDLSLELVANQTGTLHEGRVMYSYLSYLHHWSKSFKLSKDIKQSILEKCMKLGDLQYMGYIHGIHFCLNEFFICKNFNEYKNTLLQNLEFSKSSQNSLAESVLISAQMALENLQGNTKDIFEFNTDSVTETAHIRKCESQKNMMAIGFLRVLQANTLYMYGQFSDAEYCINSALKIIDSLAPTMSRVLLIFTHSLILCAEFEDLTKEQKETNTQKILKNRKTLKEWSELCPKNFNHFYVLTEAEFHRVNNNIIQAINCYLEAISNSQSAQNIQIESLSYELMGKFWLSNDNVIYGVEYLKKARESYMLWGAVRKAELIEKNYSEYFNSDSLVSTHLASRSISGDLSNGQDEAFQNLDLKTVISTTQAISSEIDMYKLLHKLMKSLTTLAGSQYTVLLLEHDSELQISGVMSVDDNSIWVLEEIDAELESLVPMTIINYVTRKLEPVILPGSVNDMMFQNDTYIQNIKPKSILCLPIKFQGQLSGAIYLENRLTENAFNLERVEIISVISSQASISINNALLYSRLQEKVDQNERLGKLRHFLSPQVADIVLSEGTDTVLGSHRKLISIIFCDLRGFTAFSESAEPEETVGLLADYHTELGKLISKYNATIDHRAGDGMMVFLNDPIEIHDHVKKAVLLAKEMRDKVNQITTQIGNYGHKLGFGVGISSGYATIGLVGYEGRFDYAATGPHVSLASRLCDEADDNQILVSAAIHAEVQNYERMKYVGKFSIKGFSKPQAVFNIPI